VILRRIGQPVKKRKHGNVTQFVSRIGKLLIELREIDSENRGKTEEPNIKTETIEEKHMNQATK